MIDRRLLFVFLVVTLFISVLRAERARNDNLQDEDEEIDFTNDNNNNNEEDVIDAIKRFLTKKKTTTTAKPSSDSIIALLTTTQQNKILSTSTKSSVFGDMFGKKTTSTARYGGSSSTSRFDRTTQSSSSSSKDACGIVNPCKNGGTCKTLSSGRFYCFCTQDYYGKNCENKFITSGTANNDRGRTDHCVKSPCLNGGECVGLRTTYYCRCKSPFYGTNCDKRIGKREEVMDELNTPDQELQEYKRDLEEDTEDLRRAIANENILNNME
ncbi:unnamed protein product [Rotaria socialis]|uniref:EGF-like domain-containing protein n=1 Tax=Rotaria socialis TaxID=392032 RepID=A0A818XKJ6_9BILA|nr:unnamed protein product [Rotaria socialis]CAF4543787.1 unnamed protein product [Rotaria socialis]